MIPPRLTQPLLEQGRLTPDGRLNPARLSREPIAKGVELQLGLERGTLLKVDTYPLIRGAANTRMSVSCRLLAKRRLIMDAPIMHAFDPGFDVGSHLVREKSSEAFDAVAHYKVLQEVVSVGKLCLSLCGTHR